MISGYSFTQVVSIDALNLPLSDVLVELRDRYDVPLSFNDDALRKYTITVKQTFETTDEAVSFLLRNLPLSFSNTNNVFVIYTDAKKQREKPNQNKYLIRGQILDEITMESLPYTSILINGKGIISDGNGFFSFQSSDSVFNITLSQLGYFRKDTLLLSERLHRLCLRPAINELEEVVVSERLLETFVYKERQAGVIRLNHKITRFLPGSSDNTVFNLLRLQPGILASAESSDNLIIWGSYEGQSRILFDGFLLFGLKNFNDNISAVNPFVVKDIKVLKAGFGCVYGDCVGGVADISGKDGSKLKPGIYGSLNNYTINVMVETPVGNYASLLMAFRHTYTNLYDEEEVGFFQGPNPTSMESLKVVPNYVFRDFNIKYNYNNPDGTYFKFSMLTGQDVFSYDIDENINTLLRLKRSTNELNFQRGVSTFFGKMFSNGWNSRVKVAFSDLSVEYENTNQIFNSNTGNLIREKNLQSINTTSETVIAWENSLSAFRQHNFSANLQWVQNTSIWQEDTLGLRYIDQDFNGAHLSLILQDEFSSSVISFKPGVRFTYIPFLNKRLFEPRLAFSVPLHEFVDLNLAGGLYNQILSKSSVEDESGNYRYMWVLANDSAYSVLTSQHLTASVNFEKGNTQISFAPYVRKTFGLNRYVMYPNQGVAEVSEGIGRSYGFDFYLKQNYKGHTAWLSYTLSKSEENFEHFLNQDYRVAPQDQRHEIKIASVLNFDPVYFSANYVYGTGFPIFETVNQVLEISRTPYIRLDMAIVYKFNIKKLFGETGISVLNVFNRENILYHNLERVPTNQSNTIQLYEESVPFSPSVYVKLSF